MKVKDQHTLSELRRLCRQHRHARVRIRLTAVLMAKQGLPATDIGKSLDYCHRAVQQWIRRYNEEGVDGLADRPRSGRPRKLSPQQEQSLVRHLEHMKKSDSKCGGQKICEYIKREFGVKYTLDGIYKLLHRLGLNRKRSQRCPT